MATCAGELDAGYEEQVQQALAETERVLGAEDSQTRMGDAKQLKAALATLDEATKALADLMMDKAMEAVLRKRGLIQ